MNDAVSFGRQRAWAAGFGAVDLLAALVGYIAVFEGLPSRYWPVDVPAAGIIGLLATTGVGLVTGQRWALALAKAASLVTLVAGLLLITALVLGVAFLAGTYGPVGRGGAIIEVLAAALVLPYVVVFPAAQLVWARATHAHERRA